MGTSKSYKPTSKVNQSLGALSKYITRLVNNSNYTESQKNRIINDFINCAGGKNKVTKGVSSVHGKAGIIVAKNFGEFLIYSKLHGIKDVLDNLEIGQLKDKTIEEVINYLTINIAKDSATLDDVAARKAARQVLEELFKNIKDVDEIDNFMKLKNNEDLNNILVSFFSFYLFESISIRFYEKLFNDNPQNYITFFHDIKLYIFEHTKDFHKKHDITKIDWNGIGGKQYISNLYKEILEIFEL